MSDTIETPRLSLRPFVAEDASRLAYFLGDYEVAKMTATVPHPYLPIAAEGWILMQSAARGKGETFPFAITTRSAGLIGSCGLKRRDLSGLAAWELGYWIGKPYWGEGYVSEAVTALLDWARRELKAEVFTAGHYVDNPASGRVLEKLGFSRTGTAHAWGLARQRSTECVRYVWPEGTQIDNVDPHDPHIHAQRSLAS